MAKLYANPYGYEYRARGFYFDSLEDYDAKRADLEATGCEEWEIDYIEGDNVKLFEACGISQNTVEVWFNELDHLADDDDLALAVRFLMETVHDLDSAISQAGMVNIFNGTREDYAREIIGECGLLESLPHNLREYFDFDAFARDMELNSEITEIAPDVWVTNPQDF